VDGAFRGWNDVWLLPEFRRWNIEEYLPRIACPAVVIQGEQDEYGTMEQVERIRRGVRDLEVVTVDSAGHAPHRDRPEVVLDAVDRLVARVRAGASSA
jgi:pimeloyl-ACP methyl ester carboxylesterase